MSDSTCKFRAAEYLGDQEEKKAEGYRNNTHFLITIGSLIVIISALCKDFFLFFESARSSLNIEL